jgi:hypothetical protein
LQSIEGGIYAYTLRRTFGRQGFCGGPEMRSQAWLLSNYYHHSGNNQTYQEKLNYPIEKR